MDDPMAQFITGKFSPVPFIFPGKISDEQGTVMNCPAINSPGMNCPSTNFMPIDIFQRLFGGYKA